MKNSNTSHLTGKAGQDPARSRRPTESGNTGWLWRDVGTGRPVLVPKLQGTGSGKASPVATSSCEPRATLRKSSAPLPGAFRMFDRPESGQYGSATKIYFAGQTALTLSFLPLRNP